MDRVSADLRRHQAAQNAADLAAESPNFADEDAYHGIVDKSLHEPLASIFSTRDQLLVLQRSESRNAIDYQRAVDWLVRDLAHVERALRLLWDAS